MKTKVSIVKCKRYDTEELQSATRRAFELLGGISSFIKKKERVLVKPNILSGRPPEHGVNTHPEVVRAVVRLIKDCGAYPVIGDNPGGSISPKEAYESSGISAIANEERVELAEVMGVRIVKGIPIASYFFECDKIVSLPKMKTHSFTVLTGAIKNMFGAVAGLNKSECHKRFPIPQEFANILVDVFEKVKPHLVLMDAVIAMDKDGPGTAGRLRDVGFLIASSDSVAVDSVFSHLIGLNPRKVLTTGEAAKRGLGEIELENIEILGERLNDAFIKDFQLPRSSFIVRLPDFIVKTLASFVKFRPCINVRACKRCMICRNTCPVSAISVDKKKSVIDYHKCIRCMCCHEVCPYNAIELRRNILARLCGL